MGTPQLGAELGYGGEAQRGRTIPCSDRNYACRGVCRMRTHLIAGVALVVALSFMASALAACGETTQPADDAAVTGTTTATASGGPAPAGETSDPVADESQMSEPERAAREWLALVDSGQYGESWTAAATLFRRAVTAAQWAQQVGAVREPLGTMVRRRLTREKRSSEAPGAPDGEYSLLTFESAFENKREAVESVTVTREEDGTWRVAGYFIR